MSARTELFIDGITCAHCAKGIEQNLREFGLGDAHVNFTSKSASFSESQNISLEQITKHLKKLGYQVRNQKTSNSTNFFNLSYLNFITILCCLLAAPMMLAEFFGAQTTVGKVLHNPLIQLTLCFPIMLTGGIYFLKSALRSLRIKNPNMDCLIALGSWSAFFYSLSGTIMNSGHKLMFYETSASIIAIVLIGNLIEERAVLKTEKNILDLQKFQPQILKRQKSDGQTETIAVEDLRVNDIVILSPGDRVPCDGIIIEGCAEIDLSFLNGESLPKNAAKGDNLQCGALIVGGNCQLKAEQVGEESSLVTIIRQIQESRAAKPGLEKLADKVTAVFVPIVLAISLTTFFTNYFFGIDAGQALLRAIAVLVISCPCALGLATPTAVTVALGLASKNGILLRKASLFETLEKVTHFVFDKTGTLTDGQFQIQEFKADGIDINQAKAVIMAMEQFSNHPIAKALRSYCSDSGQSLPELKEHNEQRGLGIIATTLENESYELSSRDLNPPYNLVLRKNNQAVVQIILSDQLRPEASALIKYLKNSGITTEILSGDKLEKTSKLAAELGITEFSAELLPADKARLIAQSADKQNTVFVGDGINDSAALARAQAGITFSAASDLARQSADIVIVAGGLEKIAEMRQLAQKTTQSIRQNLFWAFFYNILMIPIAALGFLSPMHAAFAMVFSDLIVVANSLRLKLWKPLTLKH